MGVVILAALCVAAFAILFKLFAAYHVPLLPAITINYFTAFCCGLLLHPPWQAGDLSLLWMPAGALGALFVTIFSLTGISARKDGVARTTIAGRMSLLLTVVGTVLIFSEPIGSPTIVGIVVALPGLVLATAPASGNEGGRSWIMPMLIFLGSGAADIGVNAFQRVRTTAMNEAAFTTLCFGSASIVSALVLVTRKELPLLAHSRTWIGGVLLGTVNYASLLLLILALGSGTIPASRIFPLMNIAAMLFGTAAAIMLFRERLSLRQWLGLGLCVLALVLLMLPSS